MEVEFPNNLVPFMTKLTELLDNSTTHANSLPPKSDLAFHRTLDRQFAKNQDEASSRIMKLADGLLDKVQSGSKGKEKSRRKLEDEDDLTDGYRRGVMDVVNMLLEDAATSLDKVSGKKPETQIDVKPSANRSLERLRKIGNEPNLVHQMVLKSVDVDLPKPQAKFSDAVDNTISRKPFRPNLREKVHAMVPLGYEMSEDVQLLLPSGMRGIHVSRHHPYYYETVHLGYPTSLFTLSPPIPPISLEEHDVIYVDTVEGYQTMVEELKDATEIAVDLEHHGHRSYHGFTCLIQISTREKDWIVDALALRTEIAEDKFGGVMADPGIIKVFQGAQGDIVWLQKDFQIYVVNLFDTHEAATYLEYPQRSLKALAAKFCSVLLSKALSSSDWRRRPLTDSMLKYARLDTHYLLYIYDHLRNELVAKSRPSTPAIPTGSSSVLPGSSAQPAAENPQSAMRDVLARSAAVALQLYEFDTANYATGSGVNGWMNPLKRHIGGAKLHEPIGRLFRKLHVWRDERAREEDESPHYIMSTEFIVRLAVAATQDDAALSTLYDRIPPRYLSGIKDIIEDQTWRSATRSPSPIPGKRAASPRRRSRKRSSSPKAEPGPSVQPDQRSPVVAVTGQSHIAEPVNPIDTDDLWAATASTSTATHPETAPSTETIAHSSLFGEALPADFARPDVLDVQAPSDLFGSTITPTTAASSSKRRELSPTFLDVQSQVNSSFRETPARTAAAVEVIGESTHSERQSGAASSPVGQVEPTTQQDSTGTSSNLPVKGDLNPSVPPEQGPAQDEAEDGIVVVGKKRKRRDQQKKEKAAAKAKAAAQLEVGSSGTNDDSGPSGVPKDGAAGGTTEVEDFDYASAPNLLDTPAVFKKKEKRKKDKMDKKGGQITTETFGPVAKDPSQPKGGNKSRTFA